MLKEYDKKRDFSRTNEPPPRAPDRGRGGLRFVVQKHAARRLHYDFRLELDGALKSWAVPKGPSVDPREKRLAVMVEDHPLEYASFEGVISDGNYGAGQVIVWDTGVYSPDSDGRLSFDDRSEAEDRMRRDLDGGKLSFTLRGHKLQGSWTLVRTSRSPKDWLLIKHRDAQAGSERDVLEDDRSVHSGLTLGDLRSGRLPDQGARGPAAILPDAVLPEVILEEVRKLGKAGPFPKRPKPMLARLADRAFSHPDWLFEPKLDGYRVLALVSDGKVTLLSRNGLDLTAHFPEVAYQLQGQGQLQGRPQGDLVLDGEVVALDQDGRPDFGLLQQTAGFEKGGLRGRGGPARTVYYPFDLLYLDGVDLRQVPLARRKLALAGVLVTGDHVRAVEYVEGDGEAFFQAAVQLGLEGMVAKRRDSTYQAGARSPAWLKVKAVREQELVVGGYTPGSGARESSFGALLLGYYEGKELRYAGRVGSGFDRSTLEDLKSRLVALKTARRPFSADPELEDRELTWVRPNLVARVKFAQWTDDGRLRAPVFLGLRPDLEPRKVSRQPEAVASPAGVALPSAPADSPLNSNVAQVLDQLSGARDKLVLEVEGHRISLTNLDKPLWPSGDARPSITKGEFIKYYVRMAPYLLPHLRHRPLTFTRYPNGIGGESFYQKHWDQSPPEFLETVRLFSSHNEGDGNYVMANNLPSLIALAQLAAVEVHPWLSRILREPDATHLTDTFTGSREAIDASVLNYPDFIVFDLDPYIYSGKEKAGDEPELNRRAFSKAVEVARALKDILDQMSLSSFLKTSGKTGLHIYVPILRQYDYPITRKTCEMVGRFLTRQLPWDVTMEWTVAKRPGQIFLDHNQNTRGKNMASIYSLRPHPGAPVSAPLRWDELGTIYPTELTIETVPARVEAMGDLWADILLARHDLRSLLEAAQ